MRKGIELIRGYANTEWGQVHYQRAGEKGPSLVLFHESPLSSEIYAPVLDPLGDDLDVIAFDTPGYGASDAPAGPLEIPEYAERLLQAIDFLGLETFNVGGCHTGASIAVEVARQAGRERVSKAVLTGLPLLDPKERDWWMTNWAPPMTPAADGSHLRWAWERYQEIWADDTPVELQNMAVMQILRVLDCYNWGYSAAFSYDPGPALKQLSCPVMLLNAEHDHMAHTDERVLAELQDGRLVRLPGLSGQLPWRATSEFVHHVKTFIGGHGA